MLGKRSRRRVEDRGGLVDGERGLRDERDVLGVLDLELVDVALALHEHDPLGRLAHRAFDLLVAVVADEHDRVALLGEAARLDVHLGDERAGGVDRLQATRAGVGVHARRDAVRGEDGDGALGHFGLLLDEDRAALAQLPDDVLVVDDLLANIDGRAVQLERAFDGLDSTVDPRAVTARSGEQDLLDSAGATACQLSSARAARNFARRTYARRHARLPLCAMPQRHLDRLTAVDASFLHQEGPNSHMHVGGLTLLEGPPPTLEEFLEQIRRRLHLVPRYRHKLASTHTALDNGRPVWIDDPSFNLEYHVRHTALPVPGDRKQLDSLTARIFSQQLDRSKPLWEMWLIEGLQEDRFALISKTHHSLIDGIAGIDLATVLFDLSPEPPPVRHSGRPWKPQNEPGTVEHSARAR